MLTQQLENVFVDDVNVKKTSKDAAAAKRLQLTAINTQCFCYGNISEGQALQRQSKTSRKVGLNLRMSLCV